MELWRGKNTHAYVCLLVHLSSLLNMVCSIICVSFLDLLLRSVHAEPPTSYIHGSDVPMP